MSDLYELSTEITGISMIITGLSNQSDESASFSLNPQSMQNALFGVSRHLDRIASDLLDLEEHEMKGGAVV